MQSLPKFDLVLFGGTGDLAMRKLLPALYRRSCAGQIDGASRIIGAARSQLSREDYLEQVRATCETHVGSAFETSKWARFAERLEYVRVDAQSEDDFGRLAEVLRGQEGRVRVFFLSTGPDLFAPIAEALALRFGNQLFEPLWRRGRIQHVQITVAEEVGVERRAGFYDEIGALRDMVQNHMLQLLCIIAMEPPASGAADATRDEKLKVLRALRPLNGRDVLQKTVRGQYKAGASNGKPVVGYLEEKDVPNESSTETFVALKAEVDSWRWAGVPFYLRTGKRLQEKQAEIVITFEDVPLAIYERPDPPHSLNRLVIQLQPEESITLTVLAKSPGHGMVLKPADLSLDFADAFKTRQLDAYERLLTDVINGTLTLFMRRDELDAAWAWIDPIHEAWRQFDERPKI